MKPDSLSWQVDHKTGEEDNHAILIMLDDMVSRVAQVFRDHIWKLHGLLEEVKLSMTEEPNLY